MTGTMFSTREVPWMKLGKLADTTRTAAEAAEAVGLNFDVRMLKLQAVDGEEILSVDKRRAMFHENGTFLGIVSDTYTPVQYHEAFAFMDQISPEYVAAGSMFDGRQGFMVVKVPLDSPFRPLGGDDPHDLYAVLRTSHDCSRGVEVAVMPLRGKCMNQLTLRSLTRGVPHRWSFKHTKNVKERLAEAKATLVNLSAYAHDYERTVERLANVQLTDDQQRDILTHVLPPYIKQREEFVDSVMVLSRTDDTIGYENTGWGLVNAVNSYYEWSRGGGTPQSRFVGALQGTTHKVTNKTVVMALRHAAR